MAGIAYAQRISSFVTFRFICNNYIEVPNTINGLEAFRSKKLLQCHSQLRNRHALNVVEQCITCPYLIKGTMAFMHSCRHASLRRRVSITKVIERKNLQRPTTIRKIKLNAYACVALPVRVFGHSSVRRIPKLKKTYHDNGRINSHSLFYHENCGKNYAIVALRCAALSASAATPTTHGDCNDIGASGCSISNILISQYFLRQFVCYRVRFYNMINLISHLTSH